MGLNTCSQKELKEQQGHKNFGSRDSTFGGKSQILIYFTLRNSCFIVGVHEF